MAKLAGTRVVLKVAGVDLSTYVASVDVGQVADEVDVTGMGAVSHEIIAGLRADTIDCEFWADFATSAVDQTLSPLVGGATTFFVEVWPSGSTTSATNPKYSATCQLLEYHPIAASVGDGMSTPVTFRPSGAGITRSTA